MLASIYRNLHLTPSIELGRPSEKVKHRGRSGARNALATLLQDVGVDHGGGHIVVPEQLLNGTEVGATLQQVGGEGMTVMPSSALAA
jgi:hypothetical protein